MRVPVPDRITATAWSAESAAERSSARIGLAQRPADRAPVAHDRIGDHTLGVVQHREVLAGDRRRQEVGVAGHRADDEVVAVDGDRAELAGQIVDVDQVLRPGEAELHHRQQAVPAGDHARLRAELLEERDRMVDAGGTFVGERCWNLHGYLLLWVARAPARNRWVESRPETFAASTSRPVDVRTINPRACGIVPLRGTGGRRRRPSGSRRAG